MIPVDEKCILKLTSIGMMQAKNITGGGFSS
jgi:hypothetical protein